ncbi:helix-turn-helix transcriptional regulator [Actinomadura barringtoniae]|uniref:Helix-turn-helix transcriptional regulator n=1 Tax=Actinomadura barringtoniae TaxID=1427535 RepID=A0A939T7C6_9ACTN|nr:helix-turn-helix transcriptional regulator [Actinomadura barringtoniae]MBO2452963.1 helix-turn-helix transcriptional regulator [Actinomadura barringtoniae]
MSEQAAAAKKAFATRLRDIRRDAGLSGKELAAILGWHPSKVSRIGTGQQNPSEEDIRAWCIACAVARQIPELIAVHREIEQMWVEWRQELRAGQKHLQGSATTLYERTELLRVYESARVPGILQTPGYARGVMASTAFLFELPTDELEAAAQARLSRQHLVTSGRNRYSFVIESGVLAHIVGGVGAMNEQYDFLIRVSRLPNVALGVIPPGRVRTIFAGEGFYCFDDQLVRTEFWSGGVRTNRPDEIAYYLRLFAILHDMAVYGDPARALIETARERLAQSDAIS